jgi:hypothetical protein
VAVAVAGWSLVARSAHCLMPRSMARCILARLLVRRSAGWS